MKLLFRAAGMLALMALGACSAEKHPLDRHLAQLRPDTLTALPDMGWPAGMVLCPMALYQSELPDSEPLAGRVNAFLKQKQFLGGENWSLIVVTPMSEGDAGIEQLLFQRADYDVINEPQRIAQVAGTVPPGFVPQACVSMEQARVLVMREPGSQRKLVIFGTA